MLNNVSYY